MRTVEAVIKERAASRIKSAFRMTLFPISAILLLACASEPSATTPDDFDILSVRYPATLTLDEIAREADGYSIRFAAPAGTEVPTFLAGTVVEVSHDEELGLVVVVSDGAVETVYAHLSAPLVHEGDFVEAGAPLALSGMTGAVLVPTLGVRFRFLDGVGRELNLAVRP